MKNFFQDFTKQLLLAIITAIISFLVAYLNNWLALNAGANLNTVEPQSVGALGASLRGSFGVVSLLKKYS
jgi:hypothetical protein